MSEAANRRRKLVESLYLRGLPPRQIHPLVIERLGKAAYGTIRNDIVQIRKAWAEVLQAAQERDFAEEYFSRAMDDRRQALSAGDIKTAYAILKDIAGMMGVEFKAPTLPIEDRRGLADLDEAGLEREITTLDDLLECGGKRGPSRN